MAVAQTPRSTQSPTTPRSTASSSSVKPFVDSVLGEVFMILRISMAPISNFPPSIEAAGAHFMMESFANVISSGQFHTHDFESSMENFDVQLSSPIIPEQPPQYPLPMTFLDSLVENVKSQLPQATRRALEILEERSLAAPQSQKNDSPDLSIALYRYIAEHLRVLFESPETVIGALLAIPYLSRMDFATDPNTRYIALSNFAMSVHPTHNLVLAALATSVWGELLRMGSISAFFAVNMASAWLGRAVEWLHFGSTADRRISALCIMYRLATQLPSVCAPDKDGFFQDIWKPLQDANANTRVLAAMTFDAMLPLVPEDVRAGVIQQSVEEAVKGITTSQLADNVAAAHAASLVLSSILYRCKKSFLMDLPLSPKQLIDVFTAVVAVRPNHPPPIRLSFVSMLPMLADAAPDAFAGSVLHEALKALVGMGRGSPSPQDKGASLLGIGLIAGCVNPDAIYGAFMVESIVPLLREVLSNKPRIEAATTSLALLAEFCPRELHDQLVPHFLRCIEPLFDSTITPELVSGLSRMVNVFPNLLPQFQDRLLEDAQNVLTDKSRRGASEGTSAEDKMACLRVLNTFNFSGHCLGKFFYEAMSENCFKSPNAALRKEAVSMAARMLLTDCVGDERRDDGTIVHRGATHIAVMTMAVEQLLAIAISDPRSDIRHDALRGLSADFDQFLASSSSIQSLFHAVNDGIPSNRLAAVETISRVAPRNPSQTFPRLRLLQLRVLEELQYSADFELDDHRLQMLQLIQEAAPRFTSLYSERILQLVHVRLAPESARSLTTRAHALQILALIAKQMARDVGLGSETSKEVRVLLPLVVMQLLQFEDDTVLPAFYALEAVLLALRMTTSELRAQFPELLNAMYEMLLSSHDSRGTQDKMGRRLGVGVMRLLGRLHCSNPCDRAEDEPDDDEVFASTHGTTWCLYQLKRILLSILQEAALPVGNFQWALDACVTAIRTGGVALLFVPKIVSAILKQLHRTSHFRTLGFAALASILEARTSHCIPQISAIFAQCQLYWSEHHCFLQICDLVKLLLRYDPSTIDALWITSQVVESQEQMLANPEIEWSLVLFGVAECLIATASLSVHPMLFHHLITVVRHSPSMELRGKAAGLLTALICVGQADEFVQRIVSNCIYIMKLPHMELAKNVASLRIVQLGVNESIVEKTQCSVDEIECIGCLAALMSAFPLMSLADQTFEFLRAKSSAMSDLVEALMRLRKRTSLARVAAGLQAAYPPLRHTYTNTSSTSRNREMIRSLHVMTEDPAENDPISSRFPTPPPLVSPRAALPDSVFSRLLGTWYQIPLANHFISTEQWRKWLEQTGCLLLESSSMSKVQPLAQASSSAMQRTFPLAFFLACSSMEEADLYAILSQFPLVQRAANDKKARRIPHGVLVCLANSAHLVHQYRGLLKCSTARCSEVLHPRLIADLALAAHCMPLAIRYAEGSSGECDAVAAKRDTECIEECIELSITLRHLYESCELDDECATIKAKAPIAVKADQLLKQGRAHKAFVEYSMRLPTLDTVIGKMQCLNAALEFDPVISIFASLSPEARLNGEVTEQAAIAAQCLGRWDILQLAHSNECQSTATTMMRMLAVEVSKPRPDTKLVSEVLRAARVKLQSNAFLISAENPQKRHSYNFTLAHLSAIEAGFEAAVRDSSSPALEFGAVPPKISLSERYQTIAYRCLFGQMSEHVDAVVELCDALVADGRACSAYSILARADDSPDLHIYQCEAQLYLPRSWRPPLSDVLKHMSNWSLQASTKLCPMRRQTVETACTAAAFGAPSCYSTRLPIQQISATVDSVRAALEESDEDGSNLGLHNCDSCSVDALSIYSTYALRLATLISSDKQSAGILQPRVVSLAKTAAIAAHKALENAAAPHGVFLVSTLMKYLAAFPLLGSHSEEDLRVVSQCVPPATLWVDVLPFLFAGAVSLCPSCCRYARESSGAPVASVSGSPVNRAPHYVCPQGAVISGILAELVSFGGLAMKTYMSIASSWEFSSLPEWHRLLSFELPPNVALSMRQLIGFVQNCCEEANRCELAMLDDDQCSSLQLTCPMPFPRLDDLRSPETEVASLVEVSRIRVGLPEWTPPYASFGKNPHNTLRLIMTNGQVMIARIKCTVKSDPISTWQITPRVAQMMYEITSTSPTGHFSVSHRWRALRESLIPGDSKWMRIRVEDMFIISPQFALVEMVTAPMARRWQPQPGHVPQTVIPTLAEWCWQASTNRSNELMAAIIGNTGKENIAARIEVLRQCWRDVPCVNAVNDAFYRSSATVASWIASRTRYSRQVAFWSVLQYVMGATKRYATHIVVDSFTGTVVHRELDDFFANNPPDPSTFRMSRAMEAPFALHAASQCFVEMCSKVSFLLARCTQQLADIAELGLRSSSADFGVDGFITRLELCGLPMRHRAPVASHTREKPFVFGTTQKTQNLSFSIPHSSRNSSMSEAEEQQDDSDSFFIFSRVVGDVHTAQATKIQLAAKKWLRRVRDKRGAKRHCAYGHSYASIQHLWSALLDEAVDESTLAQYPFDLWMPQF